MMIPPFSLPSRPDKKVALKEITVADAIDFAGVDPAREEEITTEFLKRAAPGENSQEWTADDRRFALFWYWLQTATDIDIPITYECDHCGKPHTYLLNGKALVDEYRSISGEPEREVDHRGHKVVVRPVSGAGAERLEVGTVILATLEEGTNDYRKQEACNRINYIIESVTFDGDERTSEEIVMAMSATAFSELASKVEDALAEMDHGLRTVYDNGRFFIQTPPHACPVVKGATTRVRVPFRCDDYIPGL